MKTLRLAVLFVLLAFSLTSNAYLPPRQVAPVTTLPPTTPEVNSNPILRSTPANNRPVESSDSQQIPAAPLTAEPALPDLYECNMAMAFTSGPLTGNGSQFTVLDQSYFYDKGDKFHPGKNSSVYYQVPRYLILHSAYHNGNLLKPLEAEFLRYYLEYWGDAMPTYIQYRIDALIGSQVTWHCDDDLLFVTEITGILRLSEEASTRLWLEPEQLEQILEAQEGNPAEWIGDLPPIRENGFYVGFCGWGPRELGDNRFDIFRYLVQFTPID